MIAKEGKIVINALKSKVKSKGPGKKEHPFYNPAMEMDRDLCVLICQLLANENRGKIKFLDGLAATGIRGMRIAKEVKGDFQVTINDWNDKCYESIIENSSINGLDNKVIISKENFNVLCSKNHYGYIDIDPFGSPVPFCDSAFRSISNDGVIGITSTDTAALCGVYPLVCRRRYGAKPLHGSAMKEIGLRILIGFLVREGIKYDKGIKPILSYSFGHYFRTYIKVLNGVKEGNDSLAKIGWVCKNGKNDKNKNGNDKNGGNWIIGREFPAAKEWAGPLWIGKLHDKSIIQKLLVYAREKELGKKEEARKMLDIFLEEADATPLFCLTDEISSSLKLEQPKLSFIIDRLKERGFDACRTHFSPIGFKTNADMKEIEKIWNAQFVGKNG